MLGRYAVSWISGYFILQFFAPLVFYFYGAADAGRVGLSMAIWMSVFSLSNVWIVVATPGINMLISSGNVDQLISRFRLHFRLAVATFGVGATALLLLQALMGEGGLIGERLMPLEAQVILAVGWLAQLLVSSMAMFMRAHKEEPLMMISFVDGCADSSDHNSTGFVIRRPFHSFRLYNCLSCMMPAVLKTYRSYLARYE